MIDYYDIKQVQCLQEMIYFEARGEGSVGMLAAALVAKNRVEDDVYFKENTFCKVVRAKHQFEYYWDGKPEVYGDLVSKDRAYAYATMVYNGQVYDFTEGAQFFFQTGFKPDWDFSLLEYVGTINNHEFWKYK